ncbi:MAG: phosphate ABC transporter ATP-binding protein PstB [Deltaproteobacteria bacterium]|nr:phosphate ABC transporter ATP-binding protein PstB [Deltaproteobacteria bacterium]MCL5791710.1 phosphate ABC transporter ATP-binding protein PstB [Deltaproteobacteria bacterium]
MAKKLLIEDLNAWYGSVQALKAINIEIEENSVTAVIGPSGCGKSTFVRCLNRIHEIVNNARVSGKVILDGNDIYGNSSDPVLIRRRIGMVFQKPNPFPTMNIFDNVAAGLKMNGIKDKRLLADTVEKSLRKSALWDEVKDKLYKSSMALSGGQQQRLCIARTIAIEPEVILMDEPASSLDPISTSRIEELMQQLKDKYTIVIVTHNMQQAARVSDYTGFFLLGELIEFNKTSDIFTNPKDKRTEDYITGRFG